MAKEMCKPKAIEDITVEDLKAHRWCFYQNDEEGFDAFEHVIPDSHPDFSSDVEELELAVFEFQNGKSLFGVFDGSASFSIILEDSWLSLWFGITKPTSEDIENFKAHLNKLSLELPVKARARWSGKEAVFNGIKYINDNDDVCEIVI